MDEKTPGTAPCSGHTEAVTLAQLVEDHLEVVYRYAYRLSGSQESAEELTQQTFLLACDRFSQLRRPERARAWLLSILRNCFLQQLRQQQREPQCVPEELYEQWPQHAAEEIDWDAERLQQALDSLPASYRVVLLMHYFEQATYREIAQRLNIPLGTVMSRLSRAKARLRSLLAGGAVLPAASSSSIE